MLLFFHVQVVQNSGHNLSISQMPVVLLPIHFDRDQALRIPSCQRSVVLRPFITKDFMTGLPAIPGNHLPIDVSGMVVILYILRGLCWVIVQGMTDILLL